MGGKTNVPTAQAPESRDPGAASPPEADSRESEISAAEMSGASVREGWFRTVGIGASAGGLEALKEFFQAMQADSGMAFVVVSHLDPEHKSAFTEILSRMGSMPVREVEAGMAVEPNRVHVIPRSQDMTITRRVLHLMRRAEPYGPHMPIDHFLVSLAGDCAGQAIGVILSGTGTDGTLGLRAIKEAGGLTFAQDASAGFDGMPRRAIAAGVVDAVLAPAQIAAELLRISSSCPVTSGEAAPPKEGSAEDDAFLQIVRLLSETTSVDFVHYKHSTLLRRIERRMVLRRLPNLAAYLQSLRDDVAERQLLFEEVLIPFTSFFREPESYEVLKTSMLPRLLPERPPRAPFRVWVPGCSTGEEAYSIAMCLLEYLGRSADAAAIKIFATDISDRAIEFARAGAYGEGITAEVSPQRLRRFFRKTDRGYEIGKALRDLCVFARQDLTRDPPFTQLDLISCRNVLIYLGPTLQERVLPLLHYALKPGGILALGSAETVGSFTNLFEALDRKHRFFVRTSVASQPAFNTPIGPTSKRPVVPEGETERTRALTDPHREVDRILLARYAPSAVVVDESLRVIQFRGDTGLYLKPAPGPPTTDLLLLAREGLRGDLRDAIERARLENAPARQKGSRVKTNDHFQDVNLEVIPIAGTVEEQRSFLIVFEPARGTTARDAPVPGQAVPRAREEESEKDREVSRLRHDLAMVNMYLQSVFEQKETGNAELRAANEEVICVNEELQTTNEELTTAREELQATNEELSTINDELRNRIQIANELGDDLVNLIESTRIPIIVIDTDLCIRRFTPSADALVNLRPGDVGRPLGDLRSTINVPDLEGLVHEVIDTREIKQLEVVDEAGAWYKLHIRPYRTLDHKVGGAVMTFIDIDLVKRREEEVKRARDYALSIVETVREPLLVLDGNLRVWTANRAFYQSFQVSPTDTEGRLIYELGNGQWDISGLRTLLEEILPRNRHFEDFEVSHVFPSIGDRTMLLNAQRVIQAEGKTEPFILLAIEDVTVRRRAERMRQETEDRLRTMVDTAADAIVTIDENGIIRSINAATERSFRFAASELIGQNVKLLMPSPFHEHHDDWLARYRQMGVKRIIGIGREVQGRRKDGTIFPVDLAVSEYEDHGKRMFTGVLRDLTIRKTLEREVLDAVTREQQRIGQELHDTAAQELTALGLLADSLTATLPERSPAEGRIAVMIAEGLKRVIRQVRTISRGLIRVEVDAEGLAAALAELAAQTTRMHEVTCTFDSEGPVELASHRTATQIYSIAREAVTNALKHARAKAITIHLESDGRAITLRVQDDGIGLPEIPLDSKGMGLSIMRYRAALINAHLSIHSGEPAGTVVTCTCIRDPHDARDQQQAN